MQDNRIAAPVTAFRLTTTEAERRLARISAKTENVLFSQHAQERMEERGITDAQVYEVLRTGHVVDAPSLTEFGEWKCKSGKQLRGGRKVGVVTVFLRTGKLFVKTAEWEDLR
jgi:hypothetical protein